MERKRIASKVNGRITRSACIKIGTAESGELNEIRRKSKGRTGGRRVLLLRWFHVGSKYLRLVQVLLFSLTINSKMFSQCYLPQ